MTIPPLPWENITTVLLDMDGTLLDLHFDNHFYLQVVPQAYAIAQNISFCVSMEEIINHYRSLKGTLAWYDVDYWSTTLQLNLPSLKQEIQHMIRYRPMAVYFLEQLAKRGVHMHLVTNAHPHSLRLKLEQTGLGRWFHSIISSHTIGHPKEDQAFWQILQRQLQFSLSSTLMVDDSETVLYAAEKFGIAWLRHIAQPSLREGVCYSDHFVSVADLALLLPGGDK